MSSLKTFFDNFCAHVGKLHEPKIDRKFSELESHHGIYFFFVPGRCGWRGGEGWGGGGVGGVERGDRSGVAGKEE
jgi:hypothetical protein